MARNAKPVETNTPTLAAQIGAIGAPVWPDQHKAMAEQTADVFALVHHAAAEEHDQNLKAIEATNRTIDGLLDRFDTMRGTMPKGDFMKGNAKTNKYRAFLPVFLKNAMPHVEDSTLASYGTCFWIYSRRINNKKENE